MIKVNFGLHVKGNACSYSDVVSCLNFYYIAKTTVAPDVCDVDTSVVIVSHQESPPMAQPVAELLPSQR